MPPNVTNSNNEQQVRSRKPQVINNGKVNVNDTIDNIQKDKSIKSKSILIKILNFVFYFIVILAVCIAFFIFVPWEEWVFDENEIENYIDMYSNQEGDWVEYQFNGE